MGMTKTKNTASENEIHFYEYPRNARAACGLSLAVVRWSNDRNEVTCEACARALAKALAASVRA